MACLLIKNKYNYIIILIMDVSSMENSAKAVYITVFIFVLIVILYFCVAKDNVEQYMREQEELEIQKLNVPDTGNVLINGKTYEISFEKNKTVEEFINMFPLTLEMHDKNSLSKSAIIYTKLTSSKKRIKTISPGDLVMDGNSSFILFNKESNVNCKYTRIGHINNYNKLNSGDITLSFSLIE